MEEGRGEHTLAETITECKTCQWIKKREDKAKAASFPPGLEELKKIYRQNHRQIYDQLKRLQDDMRDVDVSQKVLDDYRQIEEQFIHQRREIKSEINKILTVDQQMKFEVFSFTYRRDLRKTMQLLLSLQKVDVKSQSK